MKIYCVHEDMHCSNACATWRAPYQTLSGNIENPTVRNCDKSTVRGVAIPYNRYMLCTHTHTCNLLFRRGPKTHTNRQMPDIGMARPSIDASAPRPRGTNAKSKPQLPPNARDTGEMSVLGRAQSPPRLPMYLGARHRHHPSGLHVFSRNAFLSPNRLGFCMTCLQ